MIRNATVADAGQITDIYNYYIENTVITFETEPVSVQEMEIRIREIAAGYPWLVFEENGTVLGYAYASRWRPRAAYLHSAEGTVYLRHGEQRKGLGSKLYSRLIEELERLKVHVLIGGIALPNEASVRLHEKLGFVKVAQLHEVGYKHGKWIDVGYWERVIGDYKAADLLLLYSFH